MDSEQANAYLFDLCRKSTAMIIKCKKQLLLFKVLLVLSAFLLTALFEYMLFISLWYMELVFQIVMMFTPVLAGFIGWLVSNIIDRTFDLNHGLFHHGFQYAYENKHIYAFRGMLQEVRNVEKLWVNVIVGNYIWRSEI